VSKRSRRARPASQQANEPVGRPVNQPAPNPSAASAGATSAGATPSSSQRPTTARPSSVRAGRRERARPYAQQKSFFERFRIPIVAVVGVAALALITVWAFNSASAAAFACSTEWVPDPTSPPAAGSSPQPGYHQESMGNSHVGAGTSSPGDVTYTYCPPASGNHFVRGGPITPGFYGPADVPLPQGWIHNLEHGGVAIQYGPDVPAATVAELQRFVQDNPRGTVLAPYEPLGSQIALGAWVTENASDPDKGTTYLAKCSTFDQDAFAAFRDEFRFKGPERFDPEQLQPGM